MPNTKMTGAKFRNHVFYNKYIYGLIAIVAVLLGNLLFSTTAYRAPNARRIDIEMVGAYVNTATDATKEVQAQLLAAGKEWEIQRDAEAGVDVQAEDYEPALQELEILGLDYSGEGTSENDYYAAQKFMVLLAAQEGDIYLISRTLMTDLADQGLLVPLDGYIEDGLLYTGDRSLGKVTFDELDENEKATGVQHVYALQATPMTGLTDAFSYDTTDKYVCIMAFSQNPDTAAAVIHEMQVLFEPGAFGAEIPEDEAVSDGDAQETQP
ncbi:MAG: hypothetical protein IJJ23_00110 [Clostridia bacterium]|nr:hypothetical protein [Clostridia bacterium]